LVGGRVGVGISRAPLLAQLFTARPASPPPPLLCCPAAAGLAAAERGIELARSPDVLGSGRGRIAVHLRTRVRARLCAPACLPFPSGQADRWSWSLHVPALCFFRVDCTSPLSSKLTSTRVHTLIYWSTTAPDIDTVVVRARFHGGSKILGIDQTHGTLYGAESSRSRLPNRMEATVGCGVNVVGVVWLRRPGGARGRTELPFKSLPAPIAAVRGRDPDGRAGLRSDSSIMARTLP
jgi:hypothetical protein